jgi:hypothetical protein
LETPTEVLNGSVCAYSSHQALPRLVELLPSSLDAVLLGFGLEDARPVKVADADLSLGRTMARWRLLRLLRYAWAELPQWSTDSLQPRVELQAYRDNLESAIVSVRAAGAKAVFFTRPYRRTPLSQGGSPWLQGVESYNLAMVELAREAGVPLIDLHTRLKGEEAYFSTQTVLSHAGHEKVALIVAGHLRGMGWDS